MIDWFQSLPKFYRRALRALKPVSSILNQAISKFGNWFESLSPAKQTIVQNVVIWSIAALVVWYVTRGLSLQKFVAALKDADIKLFVGANIVSLLIWWLGDTFLFSKLFSFFHGKTTFRQLLVASSAQYFLQAINMLAADGALVVFLNRRKGVKWLTGVWTMAFQGLIDGMVITTLFIAGSLLYAKSPIRVTLPYAAAGIVFLVGVALWWRWDRPRTRLGKWIHERPSMHAWRSARFYEYCALAAIRAAIMIPQAYFFYLEISAFIPKIPMLPVFALTPAMMLVSSEPITPSGLGPLQVLMLRGFQPFAPASKILAASLSISIIHLLLRLPLGFGAAGGFARRVLAAEVEHKREEKQDRSDGRSEKVNGRRSAASD
jgi:hypothetical protein